MSTSFRQLVVVNPAEFATTTRFVFLEFATFGSFKLVASSFRSPAGAMFPLNRDALFGP
jgi:hypothetical protein